MMGLPLQRFEPVGWAEEIIEAAASADLDQLPRLYTPASLCLFAGRPEDGLGYARIGVRLESDRRYDPFEGGWTSQFEAGGHLYAGRLDQSLEIYSAVASQGGRIRLYGLVGLLAGLPAAGRSGEAIAIAEETLTTARSHGSPFLIAYAFLGYGRAFIEADPLRALRAFREGLAYAHEQRILIVEGYLAQDAAGLEAIHGEVDEALSLFNNTIDTFHRNGNMAGLNEMLACLAIFFDRIDRPKIAATLCGACADHPSFHSAYIPRTVDHLRGVLGETAFNQHTTIGAAMESADAVAYARHQIQETRHQPAARRSRPSITSDEDTRRILNTPLVIDLGPVDVAVRISIWASRMFQSGLPDLDRRFSLRLVSRAAAGALLVAASRFAQSTNATVEGTDAPVDPVDQWLGSVPLESLVSSPLRMTS